MSRHLRHADPVAYRRAGVTEDVIQRIGGWKTKSMFARYNVVDERDLTEAGERLAAFLTNAANTQPTVVPLRAPRRGVQSELRGQNTDISTDSALAPASQVAVSS